MSADSFEGLPQRLQHHDEQAAEEVFRRYAHRLIGLARSKLDARYRHRVEPEDVAQSVFKSFFRRQGEYDLESWDGLWSLLVVMTVRKCGHKVELLRAARRDVAREISPGANESGSTWHWEAASREPTPDEAVMLDETLTEILGSLDEREREMFTLCLQGYDVPEIARQVQRSQRSVQRLLKQVKEKLQQTMG